ncbi:MAG: glycosyltransferase family A protein [Candidatus Dojkabacteria bacterium]|nr:glycosyltransferase family A protein [Candidatus Dojkabacteria bacterium]
MNKPRISVIMSVKDSEDTVGRTIDSILEQTFNDIEFIIIDDFSSDSTFDILKEYEKKDNRVKIIKNKKWLGKCISRNIAIKRSKGEYIAITDGDDISLPNRLEKELIYLDKNPNCYLVGSRAMILDEIGRKIGISWGSKKEGDISNELVNQNRLVHSTVMFRNTKEFLYREKFRHAQDYDLFLQILYKKKEIHMINDILVMYRSKRDIQYNDYLIQQLYFAQVSREIYKGELRYEDFDENELEKYIPKKMIVEVNMKKNFYNGKFKESREYIKKLLKMSNNFIWGLYLADSYLGGLIFKIGKIFKRLFISRI